MATGPYPIGVPYLGANQAPAYSGIFIPTIWSGKFVEKFYDATVLGAIASTDYEGDIKNFGDTVNIRTHPTIQISPYAVNQALTVQRPSAPLVTLQINQGSFFNLVLDDVMEVQSDVDLLSNWADNASEQQKVYVDTAILAVTSIGQFVDPTNQGTTAGRLSQNINLGYSANTLTAAATPGIPLSVGSVSAGTGSGSTNANTRKIIDFIIDTGLALDENRVPETGRWIVLPPWAAAMIKRSNFQQAYLTGDAVSIARNGRIGMIDRYTVYVSNLLPIGNAGNVAATGTAYPVLAAGLAANEYGCYFGHSLGLTFASQLTRVETLRSEIAFGTLLRGLMVWGFQVINPVLVGFAVLKNSGL
jgi:hypothetical protein